MRLLVLLAVLAVVAVDSVQAAGVTVPGLGYVQGSLTESSWTKRPILAFYGIRYALAPSGNRRFAPPETVESWDDNFYDATSPGRDCPNFLKDVTLSYPGEDLEDCLFLNVFTPYIPDSTKKSGALLPVMVFIHGGAFYEGTAKHHPPNYLLERDVLLVVMQYRLGPLGFMSMQTDGIPGNVGFMDQVMALRWVNKNIDSFGGDKNRVTLFGQSAGAASVSLMLMSPMVEDELFQKVILHSSSALNTWMIDNHPRDFAKSLFKELADTKMDADDDVIEEYFKNATVVEIGSALQSLFANNPHGSSKLGRAVVQQAGRVKFLNGHPKDLVKQGKIRSVPMMAGITKHDGSYLVTSLYDRLEHYGLLNYSPYLRNNVTADALKMLGVHDDSGAIADILQNKYFKKLFDEERALCFADVFPRITDIAGVLFFKAPTLKHAKINSLYQKPSFLYTFDYVGENTRFGYGNDVTKYAFKGVHHSDDLLYLFPYHYTNPLSEEDVKVVKVMVDLWTSFAINDTPCSPGADKWEPLIPGRNSPYYRIDNSTGYLDRRDFVDIEYVVATHEIEERLRNLE